METTIPVALGRDVQTALELSRFGEGVVAFALAKASPSLSPVTAGLLGLATMP